MSTRENIRLIARASLTEMLQSNQIVYIGQQLNLKVQGQLK